MRDNTIMPKLQYLKPRPRKSVNNFSIRESEDQGEKVPHKEAVKYLGILLDNKLKYKIHINNQLAKAKKAFMSASKLFEAKYLCSKIKLLLPHFNQTSDFLWLPNMVEHKCKANGKNSQIRAKMPEKMPRHAKIKGIWI